jgi:hypothetical protein
MSPVTTRRETGPPVLAHRDTAPREFEHQLGISAPGLA